MRILITGATGFVGSRLLAKLAGRHEIWTLGRRAPSAIGPKTHALIQDLGAQTWTVELPAGIDAVVHLAQSASFREFPGRAADIFAVSAAATMRLLDWANRAGAKQFVLGSTGGLYSPGERAVAETDPLPEPRNQLGFYFASKRASELIAAQYENRFNVVMLRFFFVYGAGQAEQMLMPRLVGNVRSGHPIQLQGEDGIRINPIHVDDAARAIERALILSESTLLNVAGPEVATLRKIGETIGLQVGCKPVFNVDRAARPNHLVADITRMSRALGAPVVGLAEGLAELCGAKRSR